MPQIKIILGTVCTALAGFIGGVDGIMKALLILISLDYISGIMVAIKNRKLNSEIGFVGIMKKVLIIALVGVGNIVDESIMNGESTFRVAVSLYYIGNEGISLFENAGALGLPIPEKLKNLLEQLKDDNDKKK